MSAEEARKLFREYDIIVDCTDNIPTRYLVNDAAMLEGKYVVSGSSTGMEGQVTIFGKERCYRCLFPKPPAPGTVSNCSNDGVLGVVPGVIGMLQALETLKLAGNIRNCTSLENRLLVFDAATCSFCPVRLKPRRENCAACSSGAIEQGELKLDDLNDLTCTSRLLPGLNSRQLNAQEFATALDSEDSKVRIVVDVREKVQFDICSLYPAVHIPISEFKQRVDELVQIIRGYGDKEVCVYFLCRRGVFSLQALEVMQKSVEKLSFAKTVTFQHVEGGLVAWHRQVDSSFPIY